MEFLTECFNYFAVIIICDIMVKLEIKPRKEKPVQIPTRTDTEMSKTVQVEFTYPTKYSFTTKKGLEKMGKNFMEKYSKLTKDSDKKQQLNIFLRECNNYLEEKGELKKMQTTPHVDEIDNVLTFK
jgi:hypothetical protein